MWIKRLTFSRPHRDNVWLFIEALQEHMALQPDENAHTFAGTLCALTTMRGTRRGSVIEVGFVASQVIWTVVTALVPGFERRAQLGCWSCKQPVYHLYVVRWLAWLFIFGEGLPLDYSCPKPEC